MMIKIQMAFSTQRKCMIEDSFGLENSKLVQEHRHACKSTQVVVSHPQRSFALYYSSKTMKLRQKWQYQTLKD